MPGSSITETDLISVPSNANSDRNGRPTIFLQVELHTAFVSLINQSNCVIICAANVILGLQDVDPKEAKRQRDREHFARMSSDQKEERNMKKREISDDKWEATNKKRREMSDERREELNRKHRDQYKMKKGREDNKENVPSNDQDDVNGGLPIHSSGNFIMFQL